MKKIFLLITLGILLNICGVNVLSSSYNTGKNIQKSTDINTMVITETFPNANEIKIISEVNGQKIQINNYNFLMDPGKPLLPSKNLFIALPPGSIVISVEVEGINARQAEGYYNIMPSLIVPLDDLKNSDNTNFKEQWFDNYDSIYLSDTPYPSEPGRLVGVGTYGKYSYALVSVYPFIYHPKSGNLFLYESAKIIINYRVSSIDNSKAIKSDSYIDEKAAEIFVNYNKIINLYNQQETSYELQKNSYNYVIISKKDLYNTISNSNFISWKNTIGYNLKIVNVTDTEITTQSGNDLAEKIRNFLRNYYIEWGIEFVLIVGDYETVPMRYCYPNPANHKNTAGQPGGNGGEVPTDYYYADLSYSDKDSWDSDGDGYMGEYGQDKPDFLPEVYVGRIPINDPEKILYTFDKTMIFEQDTGNWKKSALHAGAFFYFTKELGSEYPSMDGATCCAYIENDLMGGWTISHYSEQEGVEKSIYNWDPINEEDFINDWRNGQYSIISWGAHGWSTLAARKVWSNDNGNDIAEANEIEWPDLISTSSDLDDDYPSIVTAISCYVGYPEPNSWGNLGIDLLTKPSFGASVGVISSARAPYGTLNWPSTPGGSDSIIYNFNRYLINDLEKVGEALFDSKSYCNINYNWGGWIEYNDLYTFNLYGDPSLSLYGISIDGKPAKPSTPTGPATGKIDTEYTYSSYTTDPNNDNIYYMFDWGDTNSGWLGPYDSGAICQANHTWNKKGNYEIKVKAKDTSGLVSDWSDPFAVSLSKSKNKVICTPLQKILFKFLARYSNLFTMIEPK